MEQLQAIGAAGDRRFFGLEADVAIGVEIELGESFGQFRQGSVIGRGGEIAGAPHHVVEAEMSLRRPALRGAGAFRRRGGDDAGRERGGAGKGDGVETKRRSI